MFSPLNQTPLKTFFNQSNELHDVLKDANEKVKIIKKLGRDDNSRKQNKLVTSHGIK